MPSDARKHSPKPPRILIVDDDAGQRSLLNSFLGSQGFETVPVASGEAALEILRTQDISMMISDVRMPGLSGIDVLREIKKVRADVEVIVITGYGTLTNAQEAIRYGAGDFISKPFNVADIIAIISKSFERRNYNIKIKSLIQQIKDLRSAGPMKEECQSQVTH